MKKIYFLLITLLSIGFANAQDAGIFESYAILNVNNGGNTYYDLQATTGNPDFNGLDLGSFNSATQSIIFKGGEMKTWKNSGGNVNGGNIRYVVYPTASPSSSFSSISYSWISDLGNGDQKWGGLSGTTNVLAGLTIGNYTIEVYTDADTNVGTKYSSNGGANYKATFTVSSALDVNDINKSNFKSFVTEGKLYTSQKGNLDIQVYDFSGKLVKKLNANSASNGVELNLPKKGNYIVKVNNEVTKIAY